MTLTDTAAVPLTVTASANLTREGFDFNLAFFAAVSKADFLAD